MLHILIHLPCIPVRILNQSRFNAIPIFALYIYFSLVFYESLCVKISEYLHECASRRFDSDLFL